MYSDEEEGLDAIDSLTNLSGRSRGSSLPLWAMTLSLSKDTWTDTSATCFVTAVLFGVIMLGGKGRLALTEGGRDGRVSMFDWERAIVGALSWGLTVPPG